MDRDGLERARTEVSFFARALVGEPLWKHQREVAESPARIRCLCSGRQAGKSRTLALLALHEGFRAAGRRVLILSAGEDAAKDLLSEISGLASSAPLLAGSVIDDNKSEVTLSNGSWIRSIPASQKQARGKAVDLLILDEAAFIDEEIWRAARYTVIARPESRVVMASTPWGRRDRFFALLYRAGLDRRKSRELGVASFHWPSTVSPLVDRELLRAWRETSTDREYRAEVLAEWVDEAGAYFTSEELEAAVEDYELIDPGLAAGMPVDAGVDWGFARDANALALIGAVGKRRGVVWLEERFAEPYSVFIERIVRLAGGDRGERLDRGFRLRRVRSETNGVGAMPTEVLRRRLSEAGSGATVVDVHTDGRVKEDAFGGLKLLLQGADFVLPRHPGLLSQLAALEYEQLDGGSLRIAVPERAGHDDLAMALGLAVGGDVQAAQEWKPKAPVGYYSRIGGPVVWVDFEAVDRKARWLMQGGRMDEDDARELAMEMLYPDQWSRR